MEEECSTGSRVYRVGIHVLVLVGILVSLFAALGVAIAVKKGDWTCLGVIVAVAVFWVERRDGSRVKVNLRTFPLEAAAILFTALESHGIQIEVPDAWATRRMAEQVRIAQANLHK